MSYRDALTPAKLREVLDYDPETGTLRWSDCEYLRRVRPSQIGRVALNSDGRGYKRGSVLTYGLFAHRVIWAMTYDRWPGFIDHINGDRSDNRLCNLREVSQRGNNRNTARYSRNSSGMTGITRLGRKWMAYISGPAGQIRLGYFYCIADAIRVRKEAEITFGYHPNHGRIPHEPASRAS